MASRPIHSDADRRRLAATFDSAAELYDSVRPDFAAAALGWVLPDRCRWVLDLGAGTGKLTELVVRRGLDVIAVDPSPNMLARLRARLPDVDARVGSAERIDLPDGSVDAVVVGSAFHWFDRPAADLEIARVLRSGGTVGLLWNRRDPSFAPWQVFDRADRARAHPQPSHGRDVTMAAEWFGPTKRREFPHSQRIAPQQIVDLLASRSYVIAMDEPARVELLDRVRESIRTHPDLIGRTEVDAPYLTTALRAHRL
ncbi:MAG: class I SAM-dependent methyltransferase [Jatrophihabitans sp.]